MPFKTRKHKESAKQRQITFSKKALVTYKSIKADTLKDAETPKTVKSKSLELESDTLYIRQDLVKIAAIACLIIGLQILVKFLKF